MKKLIMILLLIPFIVCAQEDEIVNPDLKRHLDGRSVIDTLSDEQLRKIAEDSILLKRMGFSADILEKALELKRQERDAIFNNAPAKMLKEIITVSTDPSAKSPIIYTTPGHETLVNVIDQTGEPWPIVLASSGNSLLFKTEAIEEHVFKNVFRLSSLERVGSSNITLLLEDKSLSLTIRVKNSKEKYHPQPILQITEVGPNGTQSKYRGRTSAIRNDSVMKNLMYGVAPKGYEKLITSDSKVTAWKGNEGELYIKTKLHPINPAPVSSYSGPNGYSAYEIELWPILVMSDDNGIEHQINIVEE